MICCLVHVNIYIQAPVINNKIYSYTIHTWINSEFHSNKWLVWMRCHYTIFVLYTRWYMYRRERKAVYIFWSWWMFRVFWMTGYKTFVHITVLHHKKIDLEFRTKKSHLKIIQNIFIIFFFFLVAYLYLHLNA